MGHQRQMALADRAKSLVGLNPPEPCFVNEPGRANESVPDAALLLVEPRAKLRTVLHVYLLSVRPKLVKELDQVVKLLYEKAMSSLVQRADNLWTVDYDLFAFGIHFPGRMTVIRLPEGGLWLASVVPIDDELAASLATLGPVRYLVAPNRFHHVHLPAVAARYPDAKVYGAPGLEKKQKTVNFAAFMDGSAPSAWSDTIEQVFLAGAPGMNETVFFHRPSGTAIVTDFVMNVHEARGALSRFVYWAEGCWKQPRIPRLIKLLTKDKNRMRNDVRAVTAWPVERLIMAHGDIVEEGASELIRTEASRVFQVKAAAN